LRGGEVRLSRAPPPAIPFTTVFTSSQALWYYSVCMWHLEVYLKFVVNK